MHSSQDEVELYGRPRCICSGKLSEWGIAVKHILVHPSQGEVELYSRA